MSPLYVRLCPQQGSLVTESPAVLKLHQYQAVEKISVNTHMQRFHNSVKKLQYCLLHKNYNSQQLIMTWLYINTCSACTVWVNIYPNTVCTTTKCLHAAMTIAKCLYARMPTSIIVCVCICTRTHAHVFPGCTLQVHKV